MSNYPKFDELSLEDDEHVSVSGSDSDSDGVGDMSLEGCYYDEYGELKCSGLAQMTNEPGPATASTPASTATVAPPKPQAPVQKYPLHKRVTLRRGGNGKLGIKLRRMGRSIYFSFVEKGSPAALAGIGFGDQLVELAGVDLANFTGSQLMHTLSHSHVKEFHMTVAYRPYDFDVEGFITKQGDLNYRTRQGKPLGSVKILKAIPKGHLKHLQILSINGQPMLCHTELDYAEAFKKFGANLHMRVMPRVLSSHLLKRQDKNRIRNCLQLSNPQ